MNVNFWGVMHTTKAFLPHLVTRPSAHIVNISSMGGFVPVPGQTVYGAGVGMPAQVEAAASDKPRRKMTSAPDAARIILDAMERDAFRVTVGKDSTMMDRTARLSPRRSAALIHKQMKDLLA